MTAERILWDERRYDDLRFHVRLHQVNKACVEYEVYTLVPWVEVTESSLPCLVFELAGDPGGFTSDIHKTTPLICGNIRFDGCSNNWLGNESNKGYIHGCSRADMVRLGELFNRLFDWAEEVIGDHWIGS